MNKEQGVVSSSTSSSSKGNNRRVSPTDASDSKNLDVERTIGIDERDASQIDAIDTSTNQVLSLEEESTQNDKHFNQSKSISYSAPSNLPVSAQVSLL